jgi:hypothetical protein
MAELSPFDQSRCFRHLGYGNGGGIPVVDVDSLHTAMTTLRDEYQAIYVQQLLDRCDIAFDITLPGKGLTDQELIAGDTNRSVTRSVDRKIAQGVSWSDYLKEVENLALELSVPNYRSEEYQRYRFERATNFGTVSAAPGPADTAIGATSYILARGQIGFGISPF